MIFILLQIDPEALEDFGLRALLWCYGYGGDSTDRPDLVAELGLIREALGVPDVRASRTQATAMLDRVNEDLDTGSADLGCYWRFCRHAAGIVESEDGQDHRYIQPISGLVGRLDAIAAGRAGQGLHLMLSNTQCQPDGGFHWFAVAARYTSASEAPIAAGGAAEGGGAVDDPPRGDGEADPAGPDTPRAAEAPTVVPARPGPADRDVDTTPSQAPPGAGGGEIAAVGAPTPTPLMPPPPPAAEAVAQQVGHAEKAKRGNAARAPPIKTRRLCTS